MKLICDICYSEQKDENTFLDLYLPDTSSFPVFIYFHGGGLESGDKGKVKFMASALAEKGICVISANYRMYPTAKFPDFLDDSAEVVRWTIDNIGNYGKAEKIFVGGSSAGGYISQMLCFDKSYLLKYGIAPTDIDGFIHDAGQPTVHFNVLRERGLDTRKIIVDEAAPLYHVGADDVYPPMLIIVSDNDMQNRYEQTILLVSTLKHFGHDFPKVELKVMNGKHCHYVRAVLENGDSAFANIVEEFIRKA